MKRNNSLNIPVSTSEKEKIEEKARTYGLSVSAFIRQIALKSKIKISVEMED